ncbi:FAD-dependent oxidoreductase, partial [Streptomyces sp. NPDC054956]
MHHVHQSANRAGIPDPLRLAFSVHAEARRRGMPVAEVVGETVENTRRAHARRTAEQDSPARVPSRRRVLGAAGAMAVAAALPGGLLSPRGASAATGPAAPRIVIVGAGLAGLRCAHRLWNRASPLATTVYEADATRIGGRCWSLRGFFSGGAVHEHGGAFISSTDSAVLGLAHDLGLRRERANGGELSAGDYAAWVNGGSYPGLQQQDDWVAAAYD